jgi:hypothetical protein
VSGNPAGRPKKLPELDKLLAEVLGTEKKGVSEAQAIINALLTKAKKGDVRAAEVLLERGWGKVKQQHDLTGSLNAPAPVINVVVRPPSQDGQ